MSDLIELTAKQRIELEHLLSRHADSRLYQRALALLLLDDGQSVEEVASALCVSRQSIYNWAWRFQQRGPVSAFQRLSDAKRLGRPATVKGIIDPLIDAVIDSDPRDYGYNSTVWTAELLRRYLSEQHQQEASLRSIGYGLVRLRISWKRPRHTLARRDVHWRQAKGGLKRASGATPGR
jgi:transposase